MYKNTLNLVLLWLNRYFLFCFLFPEREIYAHNYLLSTSSNIQFVCVGFFIPSFICNYYKSMPFYSVLHSLSSFTLPHSRSFFKRKNNNNSLSNEMVFHVWLALLSSALFLAWYKQSIKICFTPLCLFFLTRI